MGKIDSAAPCPTDVKPVEAVARAPRQGLLLDVVPLALLLWLALGAGIGATDAVAYRAVLDLWLMPLALGVALDGILLSAKARRQHERLPWEALAAAGAAMLIGDAVALFLDSHRGAPFAEAVAMGVPIVVLVVAFALFPRDGRRSNRGGFEFLLDVAIVAAIGAAICWYAIPDDAAGGPGFSARLASTLASGLIAGVLARVVLRPTVGLAPLTAMTMAFGVSVGASGFILSLPGLVNGTGGMGLFVSLGLLRSAIMVGGHTEGRIRRQSNPDDPLVAKWPLVVFLFLSAGLGVVATPAGGGLMVWLLALVALVVARRLVLAIEIDQAAETRRRTDARFGWLVRNSSDLIMAVDAKGTIDYVSPSVERMLGTSSTSIMGTPLSEFAHPEDVRELDGLISRAMVSPGLRVSGEWRLRLADGSWLPVETVASSGEGDPTRPGVVLNTRDLQERKALEQKLTFQAFHDPLTRLANRSLFRERVEHALDRRRTSDMAVLFIDLDNFKTINDSLGHAAGDHVLVETAHRIRSMLRTEDTAARLGGDEFAALLEDADVTTAARVAERIRIALGDRFWVLGHEVFISASIGIAIRRDGDTASEMLRNADVAMYTAKTKGKARFEIFEPAMHDAVVARLGLEAELRRAIERQEFVVHYQPIVRLQSNEIIGAEALVRWVHPTRGMVLPEEFIPLAEETSLIVPLGGWILRQSCRQLAEWQRARGGGDPFVMNVNLSSRQLMREGIAEEVAAAIDESGIRASWLVLEVTETVLMADPPAAAVALGQIRDLGVRVALDDFGSGYSSLSHLRHFPIDIVKIDKSFVDDVAGDGAESAIARGIIDLDRAMRIQTIAEGIEAGAQADRLRDLGCELGQGFFFAEALSPSDWERLLRSQAEAA
jgi:diguanylate cyclase (GGDEF)-like protein/PAS domain S-box-containing protein